MSDTAHLQEGPMRSIGYSSDLYRAVWRWHFYAGLLVLPFMITLAVTGALYLFRDEFDAIIHRELKRVEFQEGISKVSPSVMVAAALKAHPGTAIKFTDPASDDSSAEVTINSKNSEKLAVYVNPYTGTVLGALPDRGTIMWTVRYLHSFKFFGSYARMLIEIAAGWAILLVGTGVYLWWPRKQTGGIITIRGTPAKRVFWRDTHAITGLIIGTFIIFLAITGMPWSSVWGTKINEWANGNNFGYPAGVNIAIPMSDERINQTNWSLEQAQLPLSSNNSNPPPSMGVDQIVKILENLKIQNGYTINYPTNSTDVFTGSVYPDDLIKQRVIHIDQYSGNILIDMNYNDYGPFAKTIEWGINTHMGQEYGLANQIILLIACIAIVLLSLSAAIMWWKRRPKGSLGIPPMPSDKRVFRGLLIILAIGGILFPLVGLTLLIMLLIDGVYTNYKTYKKNTFS